MTNDFFRNIPRYNDDSDFTTNAESYYKDLARKQKLIKLLSKRIWEYDKELAKRFEEWDKNLEEFDDEIIKLLNEWIDDGTFAHIINEEIFSWKADKSDLDFTNTIIKQNNNYVPVTNYIDETRSDTESIQLALNENTGKILLFPPDTQYSISSTLFVPSNTHIIGYGSKLTLENQNTLFEVDENVVIEGLEMESFNTFNDNDRAISMIGEYNNYKKGLIVSNCHIHDFGGFGLRLEYSKDIKLLNNTIEKIGYAGVQTFSADNVNVFGGVIRDIGSNGVEPLAYGVTFSRYGLDNSLTIYPRSKNCSVRNVLIDGVTTWEALDTHAGEDITFENNTIKNSRVGIAAVPSHLNGVQDHPPVNIKVLNNTVQGGGGVGISIAGSDINEPAWDVLVNGNTLLDCGTEGVTTDGAIRIRNTKGVIITNNNLDHSIEGGINLFIENDGFIVSSNTIKDSHSSEYAGVFGIALRQDRNNEGIISSNNILLENPNLNTYVMDRGIFINGNTTNKVDIGLNNNTAKTKVFGIGDNLNLTDTLSDLLVKTKTEEDYTTNIRYVKLPNGLIFQWGTFTIDASSTEPQIVPFKKEMKSIPSGSFTLNQTVSSESIDKAKKLHLSMNKNDWTLKMDSQDTGTLDITLFAIGV